MTVNLSRMDSFDLIKFVYVMLALCRLFCVCSLLYGALLFLALQTIYVSLTFWREAIVLARKL